MGSERIINFFETSANIDTFDARTVAPQQSPSIQPKATSAWGQPSQPIPMYRPEWADNEDLKKAFGVALAKLTDAFKAGMELFAEELPKALWASIHWKNDPTVCAAHDAYLKTLKKLTPALDKEELLYEVLASARNAAEDRDRVQFFKLYSEIAGFTGKVAIDASQTFNTNNNMMTIKLVKPENKNSVLDNHPTNKQIESKMVNEELPIKLKLVGGSPK